MSNSESIQMSIKQKKNNSQIKSTNISQKQVLNAKYTVNCKHNNY